MSYLRRCTIATHTFTLRDGLLWHDGQPVTAEDCVAGGGGRTLQDCMGFWDRGSHMTKGEWRAACRRSQRRLENLKIDNLTFGLPKKGKGKL